MSEPCQPLRLSGSIIMLLTARAAPRVTWLFWRLYSGGNRKLDPFKATVVTFDGCGSTATEGSR
jgi:hypothetical protein